MAGLLYPGVRIGAWRGLGETNSAIFQDPDSDSHGLTVTYAVQKVTVGPILEAAHALDRLLHRLGPAFTDKRRKMLTDSERLRPKVGAIRLCLAHVPAALTSSEPSLAA